MHWEFAFWISFDYRFFQIFLIISRRQRVRAPTHPQSFTATVLFLIGVYTLSMHSPIRCESQHAWLGLLHPNCSLLTGSACQLLLWARRAVATTPLPFWYVLAITSSTANNSLLNIYWISWTQLSHWRMQLSPLIQYETPLLSSNTMQ